MEIVVLPCDERSPGRPSQSFWVQCEQASLENLRYPVN
jgi:hypothetical protein